MEEDKKRMSEDSLQADVSERAAKVSDQTFSSLEEIKLGRLIFELDQKLNIFFCVRGS